ncbi:MAG: ATPase [Methyloceanibacter sp.]|nr:MAG: ATPase [Methyloceanibacter sp.]
MSDNEKKNTTELSLWSDAETDVDLLGFTHLVDAVEGLVNSEHLLPATIGVFGDWGSGKTSVLTMASKRLEADKDTLVLWFNGWLFEGYDQAKVSLMERLVNELVEKRCTSASMKKLAVRLFRRINWLRVAGTALKLGAAFAAGGPPLAALAAAPDLGELAKKAGEGLEKIDEGKLDDYLRDSKEQTFNRNVMGFREDFRELLAEAKTNRLVVIIDDLDRCLPPTVIQTLEAIKLFLSVGNVAFVIGADERLVQYAVRERFPELPGERADVGRDYLEKLIQYPVRIPALSRSEVQSYIALLFVVAEGDGEIIEKCMKWFRAPERSVSGIPFGDDALRELKIDASESLAEGLALAAQIGPLLGRGLNGNPRQCKRFLNMLMMRLGMAESRGVQLSKRMLAKLMILEYLKPELFRQLGDMQAEGHGRPGPVLVLQKETIVNEDLATDEGEAKKPVDAKADSRLDVWRKDPVATEWLKLEPAFDDTDLAPYFYFSRDILTDHGQQVQRMGPGARDVHRKLLSQSEAVRKTGIGALSHLSQAEASAVVAELFERARSEEDPGADGSGFSLLLEACKARPDLAADVITFIGGRPMQQLPVWAPPRLLEAVRDTEFVASAKTVIDQWANCANKKLATAAGRELKRMSESSE